MRMKAPRVHGTCKVLRAGLGFQHQEQRLSTSQRPLVADRMRHERRVGKKSWGKRNRKWCKAQGQRPLKAPKGSHSSETLVIESCTNQT